MSSYITYIKAKDGFSYYCKVCNHIQVLWKVINRTILNNFTLNFKFNYCTSHISKIIKYTPVRITIILLHILLS